MGAGANKKEGNQFHPSLNPYGVRSASPRQKGKAAIEIKKREKGRRESKSCLGDGQKDRMGSLCICNESTEDNHLKRSLFSKRRRKKTASLEEKEE